MLYFTHLNLAASYGDDFPKVNHDFFRLRENSEVVMKFTQIGG